MQFVALAAPDIPENDSNAARFDGMIVGRFGVVVALVTIFASVRLICAAVPRDGAGRRRERRAVGTFKAHESVIGAIKLSEMSVGQSDVIRVGERDTEAERDRDQGGRAEHGRPGGWHRCVSCWISPDRNGVPDGPARQVWFG